MASTATYPRWMEHQRTDSIPKTSLRNHANDGRDYTGKSVLNGEIVEIIGGEENGYLYVETAFGARGWLKEKYYVCSNVFSNFG